MDNNYTPPSAEPPFDPDKYTPPSAEPPKIDEVMPPSSEPVIIDVSAKETPKTSGFDAVPEGLASEPPKVQTPPPAFAAIPPASGGALPPAGKSNTSRTIWIIVIVVLVVLCLCCLLTVGLGVWLYRVGGDAILDRLSSLLPALAPWLI